jgi:ATP-dependent DNA helicase RecQ
MSRPTLATTARAASASPRPAHDLRDAHRVLEHVFGYKHFRGHQADIIGHLLAGRDVLALMPTGGGKSLCYQIPALVMDGVAVVVSPLIALMQDQVDALRSLGVRAAFLNSSLAPAEQAAVERQIRAGALDLLYVAPERLLQDRMIGCLSAGRVAFFAIDEAHCVSQWGHDFRPDYRQLRQLAERFSGVPRIALTATADERTRGDIIAELSLERAATFVASFDRPNIRYTIAEMGSLSARERLWRFIDAEHADHCGIVYCLSRKSVEETAAWLSAKGRRALAYHAGLDAECRRSAQTAFLVDDKTIIVATIAFGMGIDKPDVRFVAHLNLPKSVEAYYQETGRAGRDGEPADAWLAYGLQDIVQQRQWIAQSEGSDAFKQVMRQKLDALVGIAELATCRRQALLAYFGEALAEPCGNCDNCLAPPATMDGTVLARQALSAVYRTGQRFGVSYVIDVITGRQDERVRNNGHDKLALFGIGRDIAPAEWRSIFRQLAAAGHLAGDEEGYGAIVLTERARPLLRGELSFLVRKASSAAPAKTKFRRSNPAADTLSGADQALFQALKELRSTLAAAAKLPPYVIFHDRTLTELAVKRPTNAAGLQDIIGLGTSKIARYGTAILATVSAFAAARAADDPT